LQYPWPIPYPDAVLQQALDIALGYLELTGQAFPFSETQMACANAIVISWHRGNKHKIRLANDAINTVEKKQAPAAVEMQSFYPRVS
jgi:hypothetical protein